MGSKGDRRPVRSCGLYLTPSIHPVSSFPLRDPLRTDATQWRPYQDTERSLCRDAVPTLTQGSLFRSDNDLFRSLDVNVLNWVRRLGT